jgi:diguanylate cyclase (GGDEF)-like protein
MCLLFLKVQCLVADRHSIPSSHHRPGTAAMNLLGKSEALLLAILCITTSAASEPIRTLREFRQLTNADAAKSLPVSIPATVTYFRQYEKTLFVQDGNFATYVSATTPLNLAPGDRILIKGHAEPSFKPIVVSNEIKRIGRADLPTPIAASYRDLLREDLDGRYVTVRGVLSSAIITLTSGRHVTAMELRMNGGDAGITLDSDDPSHLDDLFDDEVEVTGVVSGRFDGKMQKTGVLMHCSTFDTVRVLRKTPTTQWSIPVTPMDQVLNGYSVHDTSTRVRVRGTITYFHQPNMAVLQSGRQSLRIYTPTINPMRVGDLAEATGIPMVDDGFLTLRWGNLRSLGPAPAITPLPLTWDELASGKHAFDLVSMEGTVVTQVRERSQDTYVISSDGKLISASLRHPFVYEWGKKVPPPPMRIIAPGSLVRVTGVDILDEGNPFNASMAFGMLLRSTSDITVIANPPWINVANLTRIIAFLIIAVVLFAIWSWVLKRKVRKQTARLAARIELEAEQERRRSCILENINGHRPLAEILNEIASLVSFTQEAAPVWCELADGERFGACEPSESLNIVRQEILSQSGGSHGMLCVAVDPKTPENQNLGEVLSMAAWLAAMAIETGNLYSDLIHRSEFDQLTDIHNRFALDKRLNSLARQSQKHDACFGLIYADLDRFKHINDRYGHHIGDVYLQQVAERIKHQLRPIDMLARIGGDEFAIVVQQIHSRIDLEDVAARIERCFDEPFSIEGLLLEGAASFGLAVYPKDGASIDALLNAADTAMYQSKQSKRNWSTRGQSR